MERFKKKVPLNKIKNSLKNWRTKLDKNRVHSPLIRVKDSILIETHKFTKKQMLNKMIDEVEKKIKLMAKSF